MLESKRDDEIQEEGLPDTAASAALFAEQIRKDAQQEINKIREKAELSAARKGEEAETEAESLVGGIRREAQEQGTTIQTRMMAAVALETRRTALRVQGEIIDHVLKSAKERLGDLRGTEEYADFFKRLAVQGILALGQQRCLLVPATEDAALLTAQMLREIQNLAEEASGKKVTARVSRDIAPEGWGIRVYSDEGNILFDNTLDARLERLRDELRTLVAREVFPSEDESGKPLDREGSTKGE
jgi:V/A-type H+-transporting ATPase subunit E